MPVRLVLFGPIVRETALSMGQDFVADSANQVANGARRMVPVVTGRLLRSIDAQTRIEGLRIVGTVSADTPYAGYVHEGTRAHRIEPNPPTQALHLGPGGGFAEEVDHPGSRPVHYLTTPLRRLTRRGFIVAIT